jgi:hypothetical protein
MSHNIFEKLEYEVIKLKKVVKLTTTTNTENDTPEP